MDATGAALLIVEPSVRAAFVWRIEHSFLGRAGEDDVIDFWLNKGLVLGLQPAAGLVPPDERTPGWSASVVAESRSVTVTDPDGVQVFVGHDMDLPGAWIDTAASSGECVLYLLSRGELDMAGLEVAAQQGRVIVGLAVATVET